MRFRVAAYGVIVRDRQILLAHWNDHGRSGWTLPGGGVEPREDPFDAVIREIDEETGYTAEVSQLLGVDTLVITGSGRRRRRPGDLPMQSVRIVYLAQVTGGTLRPEVNGSTDEARWFDLGDVAGLHTVSLVDAGLRLYNERPRTGHLSTAARSRRA